MPSSIPSSATHHALSIINALWISVVVIWIAGAFTSKRTARRQSPGSRLLQAGLGVLAVAVGFSRRTAFGVLLEPFVPDSPAIAYAAVAMVFLGIALAVWARFILGRNWSGAVTVKENHTLVTRGPYSIVRNPIYTGFLLAMLGTAIAHREVRVLVATGLVFFLLLSKIAVEERFMAEQFGAAYDDYRRRVKALIPFVY